MPMTMIATKTSRRTMRSRVFVARETTVVSPPTREATRGRPGDDEAVDDEGEDERDRQRDQRPRPSLRWPPRRSLSGTVSILPIFAAE